MMSVDEFMINYRFATKRKKVKAFKTNATSGQCTNPYT
jgi:hypothetical protein